MTKGWTEERRQQARERILKNRPWEQSTGPRSDMGKMRSSLNALKHGDRSGLYQSYTDKILGLNDLYVEQMMLMQIMETKDLMMAKELIRKSNKNKGGRGDELIK